jgi:hypothetical protein
MDSQRAREILLLYRPDSIDANDPEFREALEQTKRDPELGQWFEAHCARQALIRDQFRRLSVPEGLRERLIEQAGNRRVVALWRRPVFQTLAAAAAIVLLIGAIYFRATTGEVNTFAAYRNRMVRQTQRMYPTMDMVTNNPAALRQYLASKQWPADYVLPKPIEKLAAIGCAALQWNSNHVSLVCFDAGNQRDLYLFVMTRGQMPDPPPMDKPEFVPIGKLTSASWTHAGNTYILAGRGDEEFLRQFLE